MSPQPDLVAIALKLAVRNAEARLYHAAPLGASYGQADRASLEAELNCYRAGLVAYQESPR